MAGQSLRITQAQGADIRIVFRPAAVAVLFVFTHGLGAQVLFLLWPELPLVTVQMVRHCIRAVLPGYHAFFIHDPERDRQKSQVGERFNRSM